MCLPLHVCPCGCQFNECGVCLIVSALFSEVSQAHRIVPDRHKEFKIFDECGASKFCSDFFKEE